MKTLATIISETFVGKKLLSLEFGANKGPGSRQVNFGETITDAVISAYANCPTLKLELESGQCVYVDVCEEIGLE